MPAWRSRALYFVLLPIAIAAGVLGYYTWRATTQFAALGERTIGENTLLLAREKVDTIEQYIISADNAVFRLIDINLPQVSLTDRWRPQAATISPSVRAAVIIDQDENLFADSVRGNATSRLEFLRIFRSRILPDLHLESVPLGRLKHLHRSYDGKNYLISYKAIRVGTKRVYLALHHDTGYIIREELPELFSTEEAQENSNVIDEDNRRVFGPSLALSGDYVVGHRFPTTLYNWRLQIAPRQAPLLDTQARTRRVTDMGLVGSSFLIILIGMAFLIYAANKERRLNAMKSDFIANVSHELKTPLSVVRMFAEMLLTKRVRSDAKREQYLEMICRESERLTALIENVLDFSALERGKQTYDLKRADIGEVITRALDTFRYRVEREGVDVSLSLGEAPAMLLDEQAIMLAVINLLDNAMKYGDGSPITLTTEQKRDFVQVRVRDHGPGIPQDAQRRVFERFYRSSGHEDVRGSGIGLSLVKHIAVAHGGRAFATNAEDGGAIVGFALPVS